MLLLLKLCSLVSAVDAFLDEPSCHLHFGLRVRFPLEAEEEPGANWPRTKQI